MAITLVDSSVVGGAERHRSSVRHLSRARGTSLRKMRMRMVLGVSRSVCLSGTMSPATTRNKVQRNMGNMALLFKSYEKPTADGERYFGLFWFF